MNLTETLPAQPSSCPITEPALRRLDSQRELITELYAYLHQDIAQIQNLLSGFDALPENLQMNPTHVTLLDLFTEKSDHFFEVQTELIRLDRDRDALLRQQGVSKPDAPVPLATESVLF